MSFVPIGPLQTHFGPRSKRTRVKSANEQIKKQQTSDFEQEQEQAIKGKKRPAFRSTSTGPL